MLAISCLFYVRIAVNLSFFVLFCIKAYGLVKAHVIPFLDARRQELQDRWFALQEKHLVLVSKKKQLATQFLQQEKQIALLTAKLEAWHLVCSNKQREKEEALAARAQAMNERAALQQQTVAQQQLVRATGKQVLEAARREINNDIDATFAQYLRRAKYHLAATENKETLYESSYAKKTKGA